MIKAYLSSELQEDKKIIVTACRFSVENLMFLCTKHMQIKCYWQDWICSKKEKMWIMILVCEMEILLESPLTRACPKPTGKLCSTAQLSNSSQATLPFLYRDVVPSQSKDKHSALETTASIEEIILGEGDWVMSTLLLQVCAIVWENTKPKPKLAQCPTTY